MATTSRAQRRHHHQRIVQREFHKLWHTHPWWEGRTSEDRTQALNRARKQARTPAPCSCNMCGNPRRYYGNSKLALTRQELRSSEE